MQPFLTGEIVQIAILILGYGEETEDMTVVLQRRMDRVAQQVFLANPPLLIDIVEDERIGLLERIGEPGPDTRTSMEGKPSASPAS